MKKRVLLALFALLLLTALLAFSACGLLGKDGVGIASIEKTKTEGLVDTYTITLTDGVASTFTVTNGKDGGDTSETDEYFVFNLLEDGTYEVLARYLDLPKRLVIPSTYNGKIVTKIADEFGSFDEDVPNRSVEEIVIPNTVTSIGENAFYKYTRLSSVTIPNSVTDIGSYAFARTGLTSVTIPNSVTDIGSRAFALTGLTSVTIPNSVSSIGYAAFYGCRSLTDIYYEGTQEAWNAIEKESSWDSDTGDYTVHFAQ